MTTRRTILLLKSDYERIGGPETLLRNLALDFDLDHYRPILVLLRHPGAAPTGDYPNRIAQHTLPWRGLSALPAAARALARLVRETDAALVNSHDMRADALAATLRLFLRRPWIANVHGWLGATHHGRWKLYEAIDRRLVRLADRVIVGSTAAQAEVQAAGARDVVVVPNAVAIPGPAALAEGRDRLRQDLGVADGVVVLGMLGRLHPGKGHEVFLHALATLVQRATSHGAPPPHAIIVGEGPAAPQLHALAASLDIARHITFTGFADNALAWLPAMDIVAVPSHKDSLPLTALEAMAYARPVVASTAGDLPHAIIEGKCGFIVPIGDATALADRLARLIDAPALRHAMGQAARQRAIAQYSAAAMARAYEAQYDAACRAAAAPGTA